MKVYLVLYNRLGYVEIINCFSTKEKAHQWLANNRAAEIGMYEVRAIEVQ